MGRHCCCGQDQKPPLYCDPLNCPLCSCAGTEENSVPEEIKYKDFLTAKYKLDGFKDISYAHNFSGNGGTIDYVNQDFKNNPTYSTYLSIPLKGTLRQYYQLEVSGFEVLNGEEFIFDLVNDQSVGCIYKPRIECLIPYGEVSLEEYFSYDLNGSAHAYMNRVFPISTPFCCSKYALEHRGCWYKAPVQWRGTIGYTATYKLYIKLNSHRAISSIYQETKTPECSEDPNSQDPPPCDSFPNCDNCIDHPFYRSINGAIEIYLVLQSCTPILDGSEATTGKYIRHYKGGGTVPLYIDFEDGGNCPNPMQPPICGPVAGCVMQRGTQCEKIAKYKYAECNQPFNHGYAYGWNSLLDHTDNQYIYLNAGRTGLSDTVWKYFHQVINGVDEYLLGIYYENWQNFSFLKQLPFVPPVNFSGSVKYIDSVCCPTFLDILTEKCKTSVLKIPISICPTEHICYKYDAATEELKDTYKAYSVIDSTERNKMPAEKDCEDNIFFSDWREILRCSDFPNTDPECETNGTGRFAGFNLFYSNDLLPYLFRNDRHLYIGNGQYVCPDSEDYFTSDKVYCFRPYTYQEKPFKNLIRHAIFGLDNNYYYWSNYAQRFFYENDCLDDQLEDCPNGIELIQKYYPCRACVCFNTEPPVDPFGPQNFQAPDGDNENKNLNPNNPEPPPPNPPHNPNPPNIPDPNDPNPPFPDPPSGPFPPPPPPLPPPTSPIPNPSPDPPPSSPPGSLPDCICNGLDQEIKPIIPRTIYQFEANWEVMDQVVSVYTYIESTKCIVEKAFILPAPWDLKMEVVYK